MKGDIRVYYNGYEVAERCLAADAEAGWVLVSDSYQYMQGKSRRILVNGHLVYRRLWGDVRILLRGIPVPAAAVAGWGSPPVEPMIYELHRRARA